MDLKGMNRYQHFGLRRPWLEHFFENKENCFTMGQLGTRQYDSLKVWLREAGLLSSSGKGVKAGVPTELFGKIEKLGAGDPLVWAIIWTNLAYNSIISKWYMLNVPSGDIYEKNELVFQLGDDYSKSTRDNAVTALLETFRHSPKEDKQMITDVLMPRLDEAVHNADVVMQNRVLKYKEYRKDDNYPFCDWNSFTNVHKLIDALKLEKKLDAIY